MPASDRADSSVREPGTNPSVGATDGNEFGEAIGATDGFGKGVGEPVGFGKTYGGAILAANIADNKTKPNQRTTTVFFNISICSVKIFNMEVLRYNFALNSRQK